MSKVFVERAKIFCRTILSNGKHFFVERFCRRDVFVYFCLTIVFVDCLSKMFECFVERFCRNLLWFLSNSSPSHRPGSLGCSFYCCLRARLPRSPARAIGGPRRTKRSRLPAQQARRLSFSKNKIWNRKIGRVKKICRKLFFDFMGFTLMRFVLSCNLTLSFPTPLYRDQGRITA